MGKSVAFWLEDEQIEKLERMVDSGDSGSASHAVRKCINAFPFPDKKVEAKVR